MKKNIYYTLTLLLLFSSVCNDLFAQLPKHKGKPGQKKPQAPLQNVHSKEIVTEFSCNANATIFLENIMRRVNILTSNDNKVKLVTTVHYQGEPGFTNEQWMEKLELDINGNARNVVVRSGNLHKPGMKAATPKMLSVKQPPDTIANSIAVFDSSGNWVNRKSNIKRNVILYIPAGAKLDIESKYADITLEKNVKEVKIKITNGSFTMVEAEKLIVTSMYGNIYADNIGRAEIEMTNGTLTLKNTSTLDINSKNSTINLYKAQQIKMISQADQFEVEETNNISGQKNYGDLRVTILTGSLDITGINADIKIRSIDPAVNLIKITNQYAGLRLPVGDLKNYQVNFEGEGGNVYSPFEKSRLADNSFKVTVGNTEKSTLFQLKCNNCTVDFK